MNQLKIIMELNTMDMSNIQIVTLKEIYACIKPGHNARLANDTLDFTEMENELLQMRLFEGSSLEILNAFQAEKLQRPYCIINADISYTERTGHGSSLITTTRDYKIAGIVSTDKDFGQIMIRPKTLQDKVNEFLHKPDILFSSHPGYNNKYYTVSDDNEKAISIMDYNLLDVIYNLDGAYIEFLNHKVGIDFKRNMNKEDTLAICSFCDYVVLHC